jgi:hypothetical protein
MSTKGHSNAGASAKHDSRRDGNLTNTMKLIRPLNTGLILLAAAAIANARGGRRGAPVVSNVLDILPSHLREEVVEDATKALEAVADFKDPVARYNFGDAIAALKAGKRVAREGWNGKGLFVFMPVPAQIPLETVPKMTSLPDSVKAEFARRGTGPAYSNQLALVKPNGEVNGWSPSTPDALADDWMVLPDETPLAAAADGL